MKVEQDHLEYVMEVTVAYCANNARGDNFLATDHDLKIISKGLAKKNRLFLNLRNEDTVHLMPLNDFNLFFLYT